MVWKISRFLHSIACRMNEFLMVKQHERNKWSTMQTSFIRSQFKILFLPILFNMLQHVKREILGVWVKYGGICNSKQVQVQVKVLAHRIAEIEYICKYWYKEQVTGTCCKLHVTGTSYMLQDRWLSPKRVSRYRVPSSLPLSLKVRVGCEGDRGSIQESLI